MLHYYFSSSRNVVILLIMEVKEWNRMAVEYCRMSKLVRQTDVDILHICLSFDY
jgi:hypothetical protein